MQQYHFTSTDVAMNCGTQFVHYHFFSRDELRMAELTLAQGLAYFVGIRLLDILAGTLFVVNEGRRLCSQFRITSSP